ncbi:zinc finger protein 135 [Halyomorpha halys]|uniref:zinc finger protein 135 n=1 Tax=Halyomorpha halys TaxID=286706 RepID=UPI0006D4F9FC|nr:zinc finger protein 613 [Halyomorpha halys]
MWCCCMLSIVCRPIFININGYGFLVGEELSTLSPLTVIVLEEEDGEVVLKEEEVVETDDTSNVEIDHVQSTIICHWCGAEFAEETELEKHSSSCSPDCEYECAFCGTTFLTEHELKTHVKVHSDGSTCEKCGKYFRHVVNMETHQREECGQEPSLECPLCDTRFHFKAQLNAHLIDCHSEAKLVSPQGESAQSHSSDEQYQCKLCPRSFTRVGSLNYHVSRKHSGDNKRSAEEFPYLCPDCGNRYKSSTQLCRHRRWECGKEPMFKCQLCVNKFHHRHGLKQHMRLHIAKKGQPAGRGSMATAQFYCEKCGRGYKLKTSLNNHIKWECGKQPVFPCSVCHVRFSHKGNLKKHILAKHVGKMSSVVVKQEE